MFHERLVQSAANRIRRQGVWPQAEQIIQDDSREQTWSRPLNSLQVSRRISTVKMGACHSTVYQHISGMYHPQEAILYVRHNSIPLHSNLSHLPQSAHTSTQNNQHPSKQRPEHGSVACHQRLRTRLVFITRSRCSRIRYHRSDGQTNGCTQLRAGIEHSTSQSLRVRRKDCRDDQETNREQDVETYALKELFVTMSVVLLEI
jgi:hypothetical protein